MATRCRITVNLAPAGLRKEGSGFDLPIALALLAASYQLPTDALDGQAAFGELALDGRLRPVAGALVAAEGARRAGIAAVGLRGRVGAEVALAGIEPVGVHHLAEAVAYLRGERDPPEVTDVDDEAGCTLRPISPTCAVKNARAARSRSRPQVATTCCSPARRARERRCSPVGCRESCRSSRTTRRSR